MTEELIQQIVKRILSEPAFQALLQGKSEGSIEEPRVVKPDGLVLLNYVPEFDRVLNDLKLRYGADYTLSILPSDQAFRAKPTLPEGMTWITPEDVLSKTTWQKILVPACSTNTLAKAALGLRDNPLNESIARGITQGIPTVIVTEHLGFTAQTPKAYQKLYEGYVQTVKSYGVLVCETLGEGPVLLKEKKTFTFSQVSAVTQAGQHNRTSPTFYEQRAMCEQDNASDEQKPSVSEVICYQKKYLADKDAYGIAEESIILVKQGTVISPLARDTLKSRRIELRQEMEEGRR
ncbi:MAG TPA: flavoprotein [Desulfosporosinus sp.]|jgi:hypothetical protein|nr:flavoprotein [Desulfosporosinus sp.]